MNDLTELIKRIRCSRLDHCNAKKELADATLAWQKLRSTEYLKLIRGKTAHFAALHSADTDPAVVRARSKVEELKHKVNLLWVDAYTLVLYLPNRYEGDSPAMPEMVSCDEENFSDY